MTAPPPTGYTSTEAAGWRARMQGAARKTPFTVRRYVLQWYAGWDAADRQLRRASA